MNKDKSLESLDGDHSSNLEDDSLSIPSSQQAISDVVGFSLCALCAIRSKHLYPEPYHESFRQSIIKRMVEYFKLPTRVENSVHEFLPDDEFTFLRSIKQNHRQKTFKIVEEMVLLSIGSGSYDARMHYLIIDVAELLGIPRDLVEIHCESIYELLLKAQEAEIGTTSDPESDRYREKRDNRKKIKKYLLIGLASLGGGAVIGVTGGLAAPIVASAFGAAIGAGTIVMSSAAAGVVGSIFGVAGAGLTASKMNKRIGDLEEFSFESLSPENDQTSLTITIAISGWITDESDEQFTKPWRNLRHTREQYCLRYESKYLLELSQAMDYILSFVVSYAAQEALKYTFLASVMAAIAWPTALISMANIIDNPWDVCIGRSAEAGKHLADVLMSRQQGKRPVSLIGFSLGARVIFFCLQELAHRKNSEGIVCDVVLLGAPVTASLDQWQPLGRIISGRIINGYSSSDWLLKFLYRTSSAAIRVAGLQELKWQDRRVVNVDLTPLVGGHMDYYKKLNEILDFINIRTIVRIEDDLTAATNTSGGGAASQVVVPSSSSSSSMFSSLAGLQTPLPPTSPVRDSPTTTATTTLASDSGIGRTVSESTNISQASLSQEQSLLTQSSSASSKSSLKIIRPLSCDDNNDRNDDDYDRIDRDHKDRPLRSPTGGGSGGGQLVLATADTMGSTSVFAPPNCAEDQHLVDGASKNRSPRRPVIARNGRLQQVELDTTGQCRPIVVANEQTTTTTALNEVDYLMRCRPSSLARKRATDLRVARRLASSRNRTRSL